MEPLLYGLGTLFLDDCALPNRKQSHLDYPDGLPPEDAEPFFLERCHLLYCGLMKFRLELSTNEIGLEIANR